MLTSKNFGARLAQAKLATKDDIADFFFFFFTCFDHKFKNLNKKVTSMKTKHVEVKTKLDDLGKKLELISTKGLTAD